MQKETINHILDNPRFSCPNSFDIQLSSYILLEECYKQLKRVAREVKADFILDASKNAFGFRVNGKLLLFKEVSLLYAALSKDSNNAESAADFLELSVDASSKPLTKLTKGIKDIVSSSSSIDSLVTMLAAAVQGRGDDVNTAATAYIMGSDAVKDNLLKLVKQRKEGDTWQKW